MDLHLQYANGITSAENLDFVNYYYGESPVVPKEKTKRKVKQPEAYEDFMLYGDTIPAFGSTKRKPQKRILNFVNKHNPATTDLRNGILASLMLNKNNSSEMLRWTYITPNEARKNGMNLERWIQLVEFRKKLDDLFYKAGGLKESMKIAIVTGKGNKGNSVYGWEAYRHPDNFPVNTSQMNDTTPLEQLLGKKLYQSENSSSELNKTDTATSIETAKSFIAAISTKTTKIGTLFNAKNTKNTETGDTADIGGIHGLLNHLFGDTNTPTTHKGLNENELGNANPAAPVKKNIADKAILETKTDKETDTETGVIQKAKSFYTQHKKVILGALAIAILGLGVYTHVAKKKTMVKEEHRKTNRTHKPNEQGETLKKSSKLELSEMS